MPDLLGQLLRFRGRRYKLSLVRQPLVLHPSVLLAELRRDGRHGLGWGLSLVGYAVIASIHGTVDKRVYGTFFSKSQGFPSTSVCNSQPRGDLWREKRDT